ncbi:MAG: glycerol-3-phosphate dehydrogenase [Rubricella sp.]
MTNEDILDLFVIGGGVNGCGIARDAAGRGLRVALAEKDDLAQATSSSSTKLFHGGLRYLEYYEFRLVREALIERETLIRAMPHISWPLRFVLPHHKALRPAWLLRLGLFIYDHLGGRKILPGTRTLDLRTDPAGGPLEDRFVKGFEYSDGWVDDARLVVLNARDAADRGARIMTRTMVTGASRAGDHWDVHVRHEDGTMETIRARAVVNAGGPWVADVISGTLRINTTEKVRLVRGSHIVTRRLFDHDRAYILQGGDGRIVFAIPYEDDYTLMGTTDQDHDGPPGSAVCTDEEKDYLLGFVNDYLKEDLSRDDIVWTYSGVRPLYDDGAKSATAATRDYVLSLDTAGPALLNVFGGKITTYRRLAESALEKLKPHVGGKDPWTAGAPLPGGAFPWDGRPALAAKLREAHPFLDQRWADRLVRLYGTEATTILGSAGSESDLGRHFGATLTEAEVAYLMDREWARTAEDVLWRRTKLGLRFDAADGEALDRWMAERRAVQA